MSACSVVLVVLSLSALIISGSAYNASAYSDSGSGLPKFQRECTNKTTITASYGGNLNRSKPLYKVYKNGYPVYVATDIQWYIRDLCNKYGFMEKYVYGMILLESTFQANARNGNCYGLCQINKFWITSANIKHFTSDYRYRNLTNPYSNLLTLAEMWTYAKNTYGLNLLTRNGMMKVCYWHNTGCNPRGITSSKYFNSVEKYANELVRVQ